MNVAADLERAPLRLQAILPFTIRGDVQPGRRRVRTAGLPTANVPIDGIRLQAGSYAARARLRGGAEHPALALVGTDWLLRTFIFDFRGDLVGQPLATCLVALLRPEKSFDDDEALHRQLLLDCRGVRLLLDLSGQAQTDFLAPAPSRRIRPHA